MAAGVCNFLSVDAILDASIAIHPRENAPPTTGTVWIEALIICEYDAPIEAVRPCSLNVDKTGVFYQGMCHEKSKERENY